MTITGGGITTRKALTEALVNYQTSFGEEHVFLSRFLSLLEHPRCFFRDHLPGHVTGSSWIIDKTGNYVLLTHHAKLNRWLQPGGHADGDENIFAVALREAQEETGLHAFELVLPTVFDIDIHTIPARKDFPAHDHYDVRFLFRASKNDPLILTEESHALAWKKSEELPALIQPNDSLLRMAEKVKRLTWS
jgi:8-oxo-dGTP pyrophosphatase MutT (NUDIX family)